MAGDGAGVAGSAVEVEGVTEVAGAPGEWSPRRAARRVASVITNSSRSPFDEVTSLGVVFTQSNRPNRESALSG